MGFPIPEALAYVLGILQLLGGATEFHLIAPPLHIIPPGPTRGTADPRLSIIGMFLRRQLELARNRSAFFKRRRPEGSLDYERRAHSTRAPGIAQTGSLEIAA